MFDLIIYSKIILLVHDNARVLMVCHLYMRVISYDISRETFFIPLWLVVMSLTVFFKMSQHMLDI